MVERDGGAAPDRPWYRWPAVAAGAAAVVGAVILAGMLWRAPSPVGEPEPPTEARDAASAAASEPARTGRGPHDLEPPAPPAPADDPIDDPDSAAAAHATIAAELQLVGIRCPLPPGLPTQAPVGAFHPQVVDGWFSDVVLSLEGERGAELRSGPPGAGPGHPELKFELAYIVSWKAERWGQSVRCSVRPVQRGDLVATVVDVDGQPVEGLELRACGVVATTRGGKGELRGVIAGDPCVVSAHRVEELERCVVRDRVTVPPGGTAAVQVAMRCGSLLDPEVQAEQQAEFEALRAGIRGEASYEMDGEGEIALFSRLRADTPDGAPGSQLYDELLAHRRRLVDGNARRRELLEAMSSRDPAVRAAAQRELLGSD
jgi:hypothetical protein